MLVFPIRASFFVRKTAGGTREQPCVDVYVCSHALTWKSMERYSFHLVERTDDDYYEEIVCVSNVYSASNLRCID